LLDSDRRQNYLRSKWAIRIKHA